MSRKYRNPKTGEIFILEEEYEEPTPAVGSKAPPSDKPENPDGEEKETAEPNPVVVDI